MPVTPAYGCIDEAAFDFVYTHDSIGLGEDGPTHQPVEQIASMRLIPNMSVWRPCDAVETAVAWRCAIERTDGPSSLCFSRQNLPHQARSRSWIPRPSTTRQPGPNGSGPKGVGP